jgi:hypothetical protein
MIYARHHISTVINNKDVICRYTSIISRPISATRFDCVKQPSESRMYQNMSKENHIAMAIHMIIQCMVTAI